MTNHNTKSNELKDDRAERREKKKHKQKSRMKQHGRSLKKYSDRTSKHISKAEKNK